VRRAARSRPSMRRDALQPAGREMAMENLISHRFPLEQAVEALDLAAHPQPDSMKIVIQPSQEGKQ